MINKLGLEGGGFVAENGVAPSFAQLKTTTADYIVGEPSQAALGDIPATQDCTFDASSLYSCAFSVTGGIPTGNCTFRNTATPCYFRYYTPGASSKSFRLYAPVSDGTFVEYDSKTGQISHLN
jgi:hypothetical protein